METEQGVDRGSIAAGQIRRDPDNFTAPIRTPVHGSHLPRPDGARAASRRPPRGQAVARRPRSKSEALLRETMIRAYAARLRAWQTKMTVIPAPRRYHARPRTGAA